MDIHPSADFRYGLFCGINVGLGPCRITGAGRDCEASIRFSHNHASDIGTLTQTEWRPADLRKVHEGFLIDRVDGIFKVSTILIKCSSNLKAEAGSTKLPERVINGSSRGEVAKIAPIVCPVLDLFVDGSD